MLSYISNIKNKNEIWKQNILRNINKIVISYSIATLIYLLLSLRFLDVKIYIETLISFNASGAMYFISLYIQLMISNKILYNFLYKLPKNKKGYLIEIYMFIFIVVFSFLTTRFTNIYNIYGGGGKILGGTYLILYYLGMLIAKHKLFRKRNIKNLFWLSIFSTILWLIISNNILLSIEKIDSKFFPIELTLNPPNITLVLYSIITLVMIYSIVNILEDIKIFNKIINFMAFIGKHTLYIFLYHILVYHNILINIHIDNMWLKRVVYLSLMIGVPIIIEFLVNYIIKIFKRIMF